MTIVFLIWCTLSRPQHNIFIYFALDYVLSIINVELIIIPSCKDFVLLVYLKTIKFKILENTQITSPSCFPIKVHTGLIQIETVQSFIWVDYRDSFICYMKTKFAQSFISQLTFESVFKLLRLV